MCYKGMCASLIAAFVLAKRESFLSIWDDFFFGGGVNN